MKKCSLFIVLALGFSMQTMADYNPRYVEKCVDMTERFFGSDQKHSKELILGCQKHQSKYANKCYQTMIFSEAEFSDRMSLICSYVDSRNTAVLIEDFTSVYSNLAKRDQLLLTHANTDAEIECLNDVIGMKLDKDLIVRCLKDSPNAITNRRKAVFGQTQTVINDVTDRAEDVIDDVQDWFDNIWNN